MLEDSLCPLLQKCFKRYRIGTGTKGVKLFQKNRNEQPNEPFTVIIRMGRQKFAAHSDTEGSLEKLQ